MRIFKSARKLRCLLTGVILMGGCSWQLILASEDAMLDLTRVGHCSLEESGMSVELLEFLILAHQADFSKQIRTTINNYLAGEEVSTIAVGNGRTNDLSVHDRAYLESPMVIIEVGESLGGGLDYWVYSIDKPDKIYSAWIYRLGENKYELRAFSDTGLQKEAVAEVLESTFSEINTSCFYSDDRLKL